MRKSVINTNKMEEGEFLPSKDIPDIIDDAHIMTTYWTILNSSIYTFVVIEYTGDDEVYFSLNNDDNTHHCHPHTFFLYGALCGKLYPWQILELVDISSRLQCIVKAKSLAAAEVRLFEKAQSVMEAIKKAKSAKATPMEKITGWKMLGRPSNLYSPNIMGDNYVLSSHKETMLKIIKKAIDGQFSSSDLAKIEHIYHKLHDGYHSLKAGKKSLRLGSHYKKRIEGFGDSLTSLY